MYSSGSARTVSGWGADLRPRGVVAALVAVAAGAWGATIVRMAGMDAGPGTDPGTLSFFLSTWTVMMVAMMLPATAPAMLA